MQSGNDAARSIVRKTKLDGNAARLSLVFQILKWASGEGHMQHIDLDSVKAAIRMIDYYEDTYRRIEESIVAAGIGDNKEAWLSLLGDTFYGGRSRHCRSESRAVPPHGLLCVRQVEQRAEPCLEKLHHGTYRKSSAIAFCAAAALSDRKTRRHNSRSRKCKSAACNR